MTHRILIVDDDLHIREVIRVALRKAGMTVFEARDGKEALSRFPADRPDLIVLDIGMPEFDGLDVCREIRKTSDVPILFLSARDDEIDRVLGLEIGGDDYVTKPFSPRELVARVNVILRRATSRATDKTSSTPLAQGRLSVDPEQHVAAFAGAPLRLGLRLLLELPHPPGELVPDQLLGTRQQVRLRLVGGHAGDPLELVELGVLRLLELLLELARVRLAVGDALLAA